MTMRMGTHLLIDLYGVPKKQLEKVDVVLKLFNEIVEEANLSKLGQQKHQFEPHGVTALILLAESHMSIHTWPEYNSAAVDIFSCAGSEPAEKALKSLLLKFKHKKYVLKRIER